LNLENPLIIGDGEVKNHDVIGEKDGHEEESMVIKSGDSQGLSIALSPLLDGLTVANLCI